MATKVIHAQSLATTGGHGPSADRFQFPQQFGCRTAGDDDDPAADNNRAHHHDLHDHPAGRAGPTRRGRRRGQPGQQPGGAEQASSHRVVSGDNLWTIARDHLAEIRGRPAAELSDREIAVYWLKVIKANRARLKSGEPDLIYPGERTVLPPVE